MINFKSRCEAIRQADRITRSVNSVYPHISESKTKDIISRRLLYSDFNSKSDRKLMDLSLKYSSEIKSLRLKIATGIKFLINIISSLKDSRIGNCYESAIMAEIIGKLNGQDNIYPMKILISRNRSGAMIPLDHVVAIITKNEPLPNQKYQFKNNEAIVLDPWLGITEFVGKYLELIKNDFSKYFNMMPDNEFHTLICAKTSKNVKEFKQNKQEKYFNPDVRFLLHDDCIIAKNDIENVRHMYPELILNKFKPVN